MRRPAISVGIVAFAIVVLAACINYGPAVPFSASATASDRAVDVAISDVTGDGLGDPLVLTSTAIVRLASCGDGCWQREESVSLSGTVHELATADFNGDTIDDVAVTTRSGVRVFFGGAASTTRTEGLVASDSVLADFTTTQEELIAGDLDGDGDADLGLLGYPGVSVSHYWVVAGNGAGGFAAPVLETGEVSLSSA